SVGAQGRCVVALRLILLRPAHALPVRGASQRGLSSSSRAYSVARANPLPSNLMKKNCAIGAETESKPTPMLLLTTLCRGTHPPARVLACVPIMVCRCLRSPPQQGTNECLLFGQTCSPLASLNFGPWRKEA